MGKSKKPEFVMAELKLKLRVKVGGEELTLSRADSDSGFTNDGCSLHGPWASGIPGTLPNPPPVFSHSFAR